MQMKSIKAAALSLAAAAAIGLATFAAPTTAAAQEGCRRFNITVVNNTGLAAQVRRMRYWDPSAQRWRNEQVRNRILDVAGAGARTTYTENLGRVGAERTRLIVEYRRLENGRWRAQEEEQSGWFICRSEGSTTVTLD